MASISMAMPSLAAVTGHNRPPQQSPAAFFKHAKISKFDSRANIRVEASLKEKAVAGITAVVVASMVVPEVAQAADSMTPSLKNFMLSIAIGAAVLGIIAGVVFGVSNFDPVKRS